MVYLQFELVVPKEKMSFFEEFIGEVVLSMWWGDNGQVAGIIEDNDRLLFEEMVSCFFKEAGVKTMGVEFSELAQTDWLQEDQLKLLPIEVGGFFIYSPHYEGEVPRGKKGFKIDSPHAFGSGHHETTKMCLGVLEDLAGQKRVIRGLDIGSGSGILALAIAYLWRAAVVAVDCDPLSVESTRKNFVENGGAGLSCFNCFGVEQEEVKAAGPYDLIVANIHSSVLLELAPSISGLLSDQGYLLLSGILESQVAEVEKAYLELDRSRLVADGEWRALLLKRKDG